MPTLRCNTIALTVFGSLADARRANGDGSIIALGGLFLWLLHTPADLTRDASGMIAVVEAPRHTTDQRGDPSLGPNLADNAMGLGTLFEQAQGAGVLVSGKHGLASSGSRICLVATPPMVTHAIQRLTAPWVTPSASAICVYFQPQ